MQRIRVVAPERLTPGPATAGMARRQAFGDQAVWVGEVRTSPGAFSDWHHHGEHTTYGLVVSGKLRFEFGAAGEESVDAGPGSFFQVPPSLVHREGNPGTDEHLVVIFRVGSGPTVTNVPGPGG